MIARIRGIFIALEFAIALLFTIMLIYLFGKKSYIIRKKFSKLQAFFMGFNVKTIGTPDEKAKLYLLNHQSLVDILALEATDDRDKCWVAKKEIENLPLFGHIITSSKMIAVDREDRRSMIKMIRLSKERLAQGRVITMFPEGTRGDGETILEFQAGAKMLAEKLDLKVQPIVMVNTKYILDSQKLLSRSGEVSIIYLNTVDPKADKDWFVKTREDMQKALDNELSSI